MFYSIILLLIVIIIISAVFNWNTDISQFICNVEVLICENGLFL